jgi:hypothetical protein
MRAPFDRNYSPKYLGKKSCLLGLIIGTIVAVMVLWFCAVVSLLLIEYLTYTF